MREDCVEGEVVVCEKEESPWSRMDWREETLKNEVVESEDEGYSEVSSTPKFIPKPIKVEEEGEWV